ncbi:MAG TPA: thiamine pyrophosphate-binding protein, partial [Methylomirabilota bacterium]|nr:thiamine pyrophosphate-binding protein [Methylomirabilota bacterium]
MPFISGKQAFLQILRHEGVSVMFGNPGTTELPLMDGLARQPDIRYVLALQEAPAIAMADGYAQASGGLGAVNVHVSPGLGNAMGMLYDAYKAGSPLLLTAGQHDQCFTVTEPILWSDLPPVARPYVKWSTEAHRLEDLPRIVRRAVKTALAQPTGPVFLSLPVDVLNAERDVDLGASTRVAPRLVGDRAALDEAARRLVRAERPLLVAGDAVAHSNALDELIELAELLGTSVVSEGVASTCNFPFSHPLYGGTFPRLAPPIRAFLMRHDLLCSIGADLFTLSLPDDVDPMPEGGVPVIHIDTDPWELGKNYPAAVAIQGDPKATLPDLSEEFRKATTKTGHKDAAKRRESIGAAHAKAREEMEKKALSDAMNVPISPLSLVHAVSKCAPADAII